MNKPFSVVSVSEIQGFVTKEAICHMQKLFCTFVGHLVEFQKPACSLSKQGNPEVTKNSPCRAVIFFLFSCLFFRTVL